MEGAAADSQVFDMPTVQMGGKKRQNKNKKGGAGVETVLAPAVLYGLRRLATPGGKRNKQRGGDAFSSQAAPVGESTGPLLAVVPVVPPAGVAVVPPSGDMLPKEAVAVATDSGDKPLEGGAKKGKKGKKGPMAEGRMGLYGKVKAWGGDDDKKNNDNQDGGKKKRNNKRKGGDKNDDKKDNNQDGGKKKNKRSKKVKGGALDLYAQQLEQISNSLNKLLFN